MTVKIEKVGNRIHVMSDGYLEGASFNGSWSERKSAWTCQLTMRQCQILRDLFGDALEIGPDLWAWAEKWNAKQAEAEAIHSLNKAQPVELPNVMELAPNMYDAMLNRGYQTIVAEFGNRVGSHFNGSQPGAGKTIETFAALIERGLVGGWWLVAAPKKAIHATWITEADKWLGDLDVDVHAVDAETIGSVAKRIKYLEELAAKGPQADINMILINPEMTRMKAICPTGLCKGNDGFCEAKNRHKKQPDIPPLFIMDLDAVVLDETHKYMMKANERSKTVSQQGMGLQKLPLVSHGMKIGMSGTPYKGKPRRFWPVLHWLNPREYTGQWSWQEHFFESKVNRWAFQGKAITDRMKPDMQKQFYKEMDRLMIRHTKQELRALNPAWAPPEKRYAEVWVKMDDKQRKQYEDLERTFSVDLDGRILTANGILAIMTREKQLAIACGSIADDNRYKPKLPSAKWDWITEFLDSQGVLDEPTDGDKYIIASQFVEVLDMYATDLERLKVPYYIVTGKTKNIERIQQSWQEIGKGARVMLLGTQAGGTSLTLDAADTVILNDETFVPDEQEQVEDRAHRTSRTDHQVDVIYLRTEDTIEREIAGDNEWKDDTQKRILDARRGIEITKKKFNIKERSE